MIECILIESDNYLDSKLVRKELDKRTHGMYLVFSNLIRRQIVDHNETEKIRKLSSIFSTLLIHIEGKVPESKMQTFVQEQLANNLLFGFKAICRVEKASDEFSNFNAVIDHVIKTYKLAV